MGQQVVAQRAVGQQLRVLHRVLEPRGPGVLRRRHWSGRESGGPQAPLRRWVWFVRVQTGVLEMQGLGQCAGGRSCEPHSPSNYQRLRG